MPTAQKLKDMDHSYFKAWRRGLVAELCVLQPSVLMTDYPGETGRDFIRKLHREQPKVEITLSNKYSFQPDRPWDTLKRSVSKMVRKDIFDVMAYHKATFIDIDLFGGLSVSTVEKIEQAPYWRKILITFARNFRHKTLKGALKTDEDPATFMALWCRRNGWQIPTMPMDPMFNPYYHGADRVTLKGLTDRRGPRYWTFLIER